MTYRTKRQLPLDVMVLLPLLVLIVFSYVPMAGIVIAFQKFIPAKGLFGDQKWIGLDNFIYIANLPHAARAFRNSLIIASLKIVFGLIVPIVVALLLNEIRIRDCAARYRRSSTFPTSCRGSSWPASSSTFSRRPADS